MVALETSSPEALTHASSQIADLVKFIRRLRSERKISDFELGQALAIAKRIPPHSSHSPSPAELQNRARQHWLRGVAVSDVARSRANANPNGQRIRAGGMTLVNCKPECDAEFRSGSEKAMIHPQLLIAHWQVIERSDNGRKFYIYRCPAHHIKDAAIMSGAQLELRDRVTVKEKKAQGRASHDRGDQ